MENMPVKQRQASSIVSFFIKLSIVWTVIVLVSAAWNIHLLHKRAYEIALIEAKDSFKKDVAYRRWNAMQGAVYVPVSKYTLPNPYLTIPERDVVTKDGKRLTMVNPAFMTRQVHELMHKDSGILGHITSLNPIRPENKPDAWEANALQVFDQGKAEFSSVEKMNGSEYLRFMAPLKTEKSCLRCHAFQGYQEGQIRGGISISVPMEPLKANARKEMVWRALAHVLFWFMGLGIIVVGAFRFLRSEKERERIEETLKSSEEKYRDIFENAVEGMYQIAPDGHFINANKTLAAIYGYDTPEDLMKSVTNIGKQLYVNPEDRARCIDILEREGRVKNFETQQFRNDGTVIWISLNARTERDGEGKILYIEGIVHDITAHKEAEEKLHEYAAEIADLYNNAPCGYHSLNSEGVFVNINNTELTWLGYSRDEIVGRMKFTNLLTPDSMAAFPANFKKLGEQGWIRDLEYEIIRKDGTTFPIILNATVLRDENGNFVLNRATMFDITELKNTEKELQRLNETLEQRVEARTEEMKNARRAALSMMQDAELERERVKEAMDKLRESEEALRNAEREQYAIFESLTIGIAFVKDRVIIRGNAKLGDLFGRTMDEMIGQSTRIWYKNEEEYLGPGASTYEDLKQHNVHRREQELMRKDGSLFWCQFNVRAMDPQDISHGVVCTLEDITERKKAEKELAERMEELERFTRLTVDRELKMIHLKEEINALLEQMGREKKYKIVE